MEDKENGKKASETVYHAVIQLACASHVAYVDNRQQLGTLFKRDLDGALRKEAEYLVSSSDKKTPKAIIITILESSAQDHSVLGTVKNVSAQTQQGSLATAGWAIMPHKSSAQGVKSCLQPHS